VPQCAILGSFCTRSRYHLGEGRRQKPNQNGRKKLRRRLKGGVLPVRQRQVSERRHLETMKPTEVGNKKNRVTCHLRTGDAKTEMRCREAWKPFTARSERRHTLKCARSNSRCAPFVMLQQPAQRLVADDLIKLRLLDRRRRRNVGIDGHVANPALRKNSIRQLYQATDHT
jgi:hypothetical protein